MSNPKKKWGKWGKTFDAVPDEVTHKYKRYLQWRRADTNRALRIMANYAAKIAKSSGFVAGTPKNKD